MPASILHTNGEDAPERRLGPYAIRSLIPESEESGLTAYRIRIEAETRTATSYHRKAEEVYYVLDGRGTAWLDGNAHPLRPGDLLRLPPGTRHAFQTGEDALVMLNLHTPGTRPDRDVYFEGDPPPGFAAGDTVSPD